MPDRQPGRRDTDRGSERGRGPRSKPRPRADVEHEAEAVAARVQPQLPSVLDLPSGRVPEAVRRPVETWTGVELAGVEFDTRSDPRQVAGDTRAVAAFDGRTVYTGLAEALAGTPLAREIVAHELVHAAQLQVGDQIEGEPRGGLLRPLKLQLCGSSSSALDVVRSGKALTAADATKFLDYYERLGAPDRDNVVTEFHKTGDANTGIKRLLAAVDPADMETRRALISDIQERVQRLTAQQISGMTDDQLAAKQGAKMKAEAEARALAAAAADAAKKGLPPPKTVPPSEIEKEQNAETKKTSPVIKTVVNAWDALAAVPGAQAAWNTRATTAITNVVAACKKKAPGFGIVAANIKWAPKEVAAAGANVFAFSGNPISVGMRFVETAEADPEYCVSTVIHEIAGHPDFGDRFKSYEAEIYAGAHKKEPALGSPWDTDEETNTFGYIGTEIYAALRGLPFEKALTPAHAKAGLVTAIDPESNIDNKIGLLKSKYEPTVAAALLQGLYERFRIDPRIDPTAMALFLKIAEKHFPKVLKK